MIFSGHSCAWSSPANTPGQLEQAVGTRVAGLATAMRRTDPLTAKRLTVVAASLEPGSHEARHTLFQPRSSLTGGI
ncbi:hypothetical protein [Streptosporangium amethystogenes]|uniref:hypothetical protein n=1 Tax=Streptosporangium amethystogenes TaxID=2002 RepID=UPI0012FB8C5C|nr:hypothetical protein [Streptosporangium amethystogenes]